jgi:hypothetical protein
MPRRTFACILAALGLAVMLAPTSAFAKFVCGVKETSEGFVALRTEPNSESRLVAKMRAGDTMWIDLERLVPPRDGWVFINWVKQETEAKTGGITSQIDGKGWVRENLMDEECD